MEQLSSEIRRYVKHTFPHFYNLLKKTKKILHDIAFHVKTPGKLSFKIYTYLYFTFNKKMRDKYTMNDNIERKFYLFDNRKANPIHITQAICDSVLKKIEDGSFAYYGATYNYILDAITKYPIAGKTVLICGLAGCNCDMISIYHGAGKVYVTDYQPVIHEHPQVFSYHVNDFVKLGITVDVALSISSFEHDGLGRYGDPFVPNGDLIAMNNVKRLMKKNGLLFLAVPVGPDCICFNAHRIYGRTRLPILLNGWELVDSFGFDESFFNGEVSIFPREQPVFVLRNTVE